MIDFVRRWIVLCLIVLAAVACNGPSLPILTKAEPTATPRATRTPRPTFTPVLADTDTPAGPTAANTGAPTTVAQAPATSAPVPDEPTNTPAPKPPTNTPAPRPPTNTPRPAPPTNTPQPPAPPANTPVPPAPQLQFTAGVGDTSFSNNCSLTAINGQIVNKAGDPIGGFKFHVSADGWKGADSNASSNGWSNANAPTKYNADVILDSRAPKPGKWYVTLVDDEGNALSNTLTVYTDGQSDTKDCGIATKNGGGVQVVPVVFRRN